MQLDFNIKTQQERSAAVHKIDLASMSNHEATTIANYILWGTDGNSTATEIAKNYGYELPSKHKHWNNTEKHNTMSLDAITELGIEPKTSIGTSKNIKTVFNRDEARRKAPPHILTSLEAIWKQCDELELITTYYDIHHRGRVKPIRTELAERFNATQHDHFSEQAMTLTQQQYLAMKHLIIELRTEQYSLRDSYAAPIGTSTKATPGAPLNDVSHHLTTLPLDLGFMSLPISRLTKNDWKDWIGNNSVLPYINNTNTLPAFDFREPDHLAQLVNQYLELQENIKQEPTTLEECESMLPQFIQMFNMYVRLADLSPTHLYILKAKINHIPNTEIVDTIATTWGHKYGVNYISTIYHKKILQAIAETVELHFASITNIHDPSKFKTCRTCGATLLKDPAFFMRKKRVSDGFAPHCKKCAALQRAKVKEKNK